MNNDSEIERLYSELATIATELVKLKDPIGTLLLALFYALKVNYRILYTTTNFLKGEVVASLKLN